jgi:glutathione synthase/RimK-type ligase-like ATP-grasp enzyme
MKLARPNIFHPRIGLAACPQLVDGDGDDDGLVGALRARGLHARWLSWDDPQTESADLVILRATWDYTERRDEFLAWTRRVRNLLNAPAVVAWNSDKHYLHDLAAAGVPVVPSVFFEPGDTVSAADFGGEVVVKPAIGAGSIDTQRFVDVDAAAAHAVTLLDSGRSALVQPYDERVAAGETALVFLGGEESHAFAKGPMLPPQGTRQRLHASGTYVEESLSPADPDVELWELGYDALDAAAAHLGIARSELLYARVDFIGGGADAVLLELELVEPGLGWRQLDEKNRELRQRSFAVQVETALDRLGLGPLSHRGP